MPKIFNNLLSFKGGVHPKEYKYLTSSLPFEKIPTPSKIILPLSQNIGAPSTPIVNKKDEVFAGQLIATQNGPISAPIYSPVSGNVLSIGIEDTVSSFTKESITIKSNENLEMELFPKLDLNNISDKEICKRVQMAGIVGLGGAAFPTYFKLTPPKDKIIDYVILNGCECEPYLTRDYRLMIERPKDLIAGLKLIMKALNLEKGAIGIEDNKQDAIDVLQNLVKDDNSIKIFSLKTKYPQGAEKMLIKAILNREVPPGKLPFDVGVAIQNIGTAIAIYEAVYLGMPLISASLTVSGLGIKTPKNLIVPIGTPLIDILEYCGGIMEDAKRVVVGGPMMGITQHNLNAPIMKATSGILVLTEKEINQFDETNCLRCGKCIEVCPVNLTPTKLARFSQLGRISEAEENGIFNCMECGTCAYVCPANIPLVQWIAFGKKKLSLAKKAV
ncbi:MAG: electron transport complex subunit RsxC [Ignavibacteriales bacterium CG18_big_fil_WC_8_21_14_2_50_31_20]|nr:MAG: electron transport complex subunit RsxC [Ignavibacteriales bacterium CG18_big_fil_WC_8_21_14_2_50_31_20]